MFINIYFLFAFVHTISARVGVLTCVSRDDCADGYSCYEGICTKCLKCDMLLRKGSNCVVDFKECGECLTGYERVLITDVTDAIKPCKPVRLKEKLNSLQCANDKACPPRYYCQEQACVECFNCSLVNRQSPFGNCAKLLSDCSSCMKGFEEVKVTMNTDFKLCERQTVTAAPEVPNVITCGNFGIVGMFIFVLIGATASALIKRPKVKILAKSQSPKLPSAPPLYVMDMPQHIRKLEEQDCSVALTLEYKQQAQVFKQPSALYYYTGDETQAQDAALEITQDSVPTFWHLTASSTEADAVVVDPSGIFVQNHVEQRGGTFVTDSSQQPRDVSHTPISVSEHDDNQLRDGLGEDVYSNNSHEGKNSSN